MHVRSNETKLTLDLIPDIIRIFFLNCVLVEVVLLVA